MSRSTSRCPRGSDGGFTLVEVLAALTVFAIIATAVLPLIITSVRASTVAKMDTGARQLTQERIEKMRNLPFHTDQAANAGPDLLDRYFPSLVAATSADTAGFVSASAARLAGEPAGAFYRYLVDAAELAPDVTTSKTFSRYSQRVATQFLKADGSPFAPTTWSALTGPADEAVPASIVRTTVTTTWQAGLLSKRYTVSTEIADAIRAPALARGELRTSAVRIGGPFLDAASATDRDLLLEAGTLTIDGQITRGARVAVSEKGAFASLVPGGRVDGASAGITSPGDATAAVATASAQGLTDTAATGAPIVAAFGRTQADAVSTSVSDGQILAGTSTTPAAASVLSGEQISLTNRPTLTDSALRLSTTNPVVRMISDATDANLAAAAARSTGRLASTGGSAHSVAAAGTLQTPTFGVLPTTFAEGGLIQVRLVTSTATCAAGVGAAAPTLTYSGVARYWRYDPTTQTEAYSPWLTLADTQSTDPLAAIRGAGTTASTIAHHDTSQDVTYDRYFAGMASATAATLAAERKSMTSGVEVNHPGLIRISTVSLLQGADAPLTLSLGVVSCTAEDRR